eukprot:TRINITY_DN1224_c0_g1_i1.p1 TRINITY_DN1224_c0_g1~~TRINITY_DN1224_c0_g1_i1.p1  ORF type:complete len:418 (-),score=77.48 TRINITY_DN1224_c0_g1_i1:411-1664(-)
MTVLFLTAQSYNTLHKTSLNYTAQRINQKRTKFRGKRRHLTYRMSLQPQVKFNSVDQEVNEVVEEGGGGGGNGSQDEGGDGAGRFAVGWCSLQGPRESMEDVIDVVKDGPCGYMYAGVFDGHGGTEAANWLKDKFYGVILQVLEKQQCVEQAEDCDIIDIFEKADGLSCPVQLRQAIIDSFHEADQQLLKYLETQNDDVKSQAGSTATVALVRKDKVFVANVGDSRAVLCCEDNTYLDLTREHRVWGRGSEVQSETERVQQAGGWIKDGRVCDILAVSRAFGDWEFKGEGLQDLLKYGVREGFWKQDFAEKVEFKSDPIVSTPDVTEIRVSEQDQAVVVATDGLWDVMDSLEVSRYVRQHFTRRRDPQWIAEGLANLALKRYTADNVGVIVIDVWGEEKWARAAEVRKSRSQLFGIF